MLARALRSAGCDVEFCDSPSESQGKADILFVDAQARQATELAELLEVVGDEGSVIILGDSLESDDIARLLREKGLDHLIAEPEGQDEAELMVTTVKLASGDIFGLDKYLPWGTKIHEREIRSYADKRAALDAVVEHAQSVGARRALMARLEHVTDELLMNALYDAPAVHHGVSTVDRIQVVRDGGDAAAPVESAVLRYGCDGKYFGVAISDPYGALRKEVIFDHLVRARREHGAPNPADRQGGAGLGLYLILSSVTRFIVNIQPGSRTEVVCLLDLRKSGREMDTCAKSVHIFTGIAGSAA